MIHYGQFCPISKAMEVLGERWSLLIIRELLLGSERFSELQRGLPNISPTMLNRRIGELVDCGLINKTRESSQRGHRYTLSASGQELEPVLVALGSWGMRWARGQMSNDELDVHQLMAEIQRGCQPENLPKSGRSIIHFHFTDLENFNHWWLKIDNEEVDLCMEPPGQDEDLLIQTTLRCMTEIWMGDTQVTHASDSGRLTLIGLSPYERSFTKWIGQHRLAQVRPASA